MPRGASRDRELSPRQIACDWIRRHSKSKGTQRLVLSVIGNWIDDYGNSSPYLGVIMHEANISQTAAYKAIHELIEMGELKVRRHGKSGRPTEYWVCVPDEYDPRAEAWNPIEKQYEPKSSIPVGGKRERHDDSSIPNSEFSIPKYGSSIPASGRESLNNKSPNYQSKRYRVKETSRGTGLQIFGGQANQSNITLLRSERRGFVECNERDCATHCGEMARRPREICDHFNNAVWSNHGLIALPESQKPTEGPLGHEASHFSA